MSSEKRKTAAQRGYDHKWRKKRKLFLLSHPLCRYCEERGIVTAATVVDHIIPHKNNRALFEDETNWQPLCKDCHDRVKQKEEIHGYLPDIGADGWPVDENHPVNAYGKAKGG